MTLPKKDDFEDGNYTSNPAWTKSGGGTASVQSSVVKVGTYAVQLNYTGGSTGNTADLVTSADGTPDEWTAWARTTNINMNSWGGYRLRDSGNTQRASIYFQSGAIKRWPGGDTLVASASSNTWYLFKIVYPDGASNIASFYVYDSDGTTLLGSDTSVNVGTYTIDNVQIDSGRYITTAMTTYYDDVTYGGQPGITKDGTARTRVTLTDTSTGNATVDWQYDKMIRINNASGGSLTNYQVRLNIDSTWTHFWDNVKSDGGDVRVMSSDRTTQYSYWIEDWDYSGETATIWFKMPSISTGNNYAYVYYGQASATSEEDGDDTFEAFDDFPGSSLDSSKWNSTTQSGASITVSSGELQMAVSQTDNYANIEWKTTTYTPSTGYAFRGRLKFNSGNRYHHMFSLGDGSDKERGSGGGYAQNNGIGMTTSHASTYYTIDSSSGGTGSSTNSSSGYTVTNYNVIEVAQNGTSSAKMWINDSDETTVSSNIDSGSGRYFYVWHNGWDNTSSTVYYDWLLLRKYASTDTTSFGVTSYTKTQTGNARIKIVQTKTQTGNARIKISKTKTQTGNANISLAKSITKDGDARLTVTGSKSPTGNSRILLTDNTKAQSANARMVIPFTKSQSGDARMRVPLTKAQSGNADLQVTLTKVKTGIGRIETTPEHIYNGHARIEVNKTKTQTGNSRIEIIYTKSQSGNARMTIPSDKSQSGNARISIIGSKEQSANARLVVSLTKAQSGNARLQVSLTKASAGNARIAITGQVDKTGNAAIKHRRTKTSMGNAHIELSQEVRLLIQPKVYSADSHAIPETYSADGAATPKIYKISSAGG